MNELHAPLAKTGPKGEWAFCFGSDLRRLALVLAHNWFSARTLAAARLGCAASEVTCVKNPTL